MAEITGHSWFLVIPVLLVILLNIVFLSNVIRTLRYNNSCLSEMLYK